MSPRPPRSIPLVVSDDVTPPPHDLGAGAQRAWEHAEAIGRRVALAVGERLDTLGAQLAELAERDRPPPAPPAPAVVAIPPPAAPPPPRWLPTVLQVLALLIGLLGAAFVLYGQLVTLGRDVDNLGKRQIEAEERTGTRLERLEDRIERLRAPAPAPPAIPNNPTGGP